MATSLAELLNASDTKFPDVRAHLDALQATERAAEVRGLGRRSIIRLYELAAEGEPLAPEDMLRPVAGAAVADEREVRWLGKNTLPAFSYFEKRFAREQGEVVGYNWNWHGPVSGWGYFTCVTVDDPRGRLLFDYTKLPPRAPDGWPPIKSNRRGLSYFIYRDTHDFMRRVRDDVVIGCATRLGKPLGQYFVLCRDGAGQ